jgi:hypothetical protein
MKPIIILCLALVLSGGLFGCSKSVPRPASTIVPEQKARFTYDWRPQLYSRVWTNGNWLYSYTSEDYYNKAVMKLKQSKVPTEEEAISVAIGTGRLPMDDLENWRVTALLSLNEADPELGNKNDFVWEVRSTFSTVTISGLVWVDAFTGKVKVFYPPKANKTN